MHLKTRHTVQQWEEIVKDGIKALTSIYFSKLKKNLCNALRFKAPFCPLATSLGSISIKALTML